MLDVWELIRVAQWNGNDTELSNASSEDNSRRKHVMERGYWKLEVVESPGPLQTVGLEACFFFNTLRAESKMSTAAAGAVLGGAREDFFGRGLGGLWAQCDYDIVLRSALSSLFHPHFVPFQPLCWI